MARRPDGHETPYVETEALLAVMNRDPDTAGEILAGMLDGEVARLGDQATFLADLCRREIRSRSHAARTPDV